MYQSPFESTFTLPKGLLYFFDGLDRQVAATLKTLVAEQQESIALLPQMKHPVEQLLV